MGLQTLADDASTNVRKDPLFRTEENPIFLLSGGTDRMNTDTRSVFIRFPIGESGGKTGRSLHSVRGPPCPPTAQRGFTDDPR